MKQTQLAAGVVMVEPRDFGFNEDTAADNAFQHHPDQDTKITQKLAQTEFWAMVELLDKHHLEVVTLESPEGRVVTDAVFPNNWFTTTTTELLVYPMKTTSRQAEVQIEPLIEALTRKGYKRPELIDLREQGALDGVLEGTGVLIFNHPTRDVFANISDRCQATALESFCHKFEYTPWPFEAVTNILVPVYHTNVMMSCGEDFAVLAEDTLTANQLNHYSRQKLYELYNDVVVISETQMVESFCGNILQVKNQRDEPQIVMSQAAFNGFTAAQIKTLEKHGELVPCAIPTIEYVGGGSARCMIAEIFLEKA